MVKVTKWKRSRKGGWEVDIRVTLPDGTRIRERRVLPVSARSGALRWGQQREGVLLAQWGKKEDDKAPAPTLSEFWGRFIEGYSRANREKPSSINSKESIFKVHLAPALGDKRLDEIGDEDVQALKARLADRSPKTVNNVLTVLGRLLRTALEWGVICRMPCRVRLLKVAVRTMTFYEEETYEGLVAAAARQDPRIHIAILLGGDAGLRLGEIFALEWPDCDLRRGRLLVRRSEWQGEVTVPKGWKERGVPMTPRLAAALAAHHHLRGARVLLQDDGTPVDRSWLWYAMKIAQRRANMPANGRWHILRHTFCSRLAMRNVPAMSIKELAGHASLQTTLGYMHLSSTAREQAIAALGQGAAEVRGDVRETAPLARSTSNGIV